MAKEVRLPVTILTVSRIFLHYHMTDVGGARKEFFARRRHVL